MVAGIKSFHRLEKLFPDVLFGVGQLIIIQRFHHIKADHPGNHVICRTHHIVGRRIRGDFGKHDLIGLIFIVDHFDARFFLEHFDHFRINIFPVIVNINLIAVFREDSAKEQCQINNAQTGS